MSANINRRKFIGNSAAAVAAFTIIPRHVLGGNGFLAANDRINLGYIGVGKQVTRPAGRNRQDARKQLFWLPVMWIRKSLRISKQKQKQITKPKMFRPT